MLSNMASMVIDTHNQKETEAKEFVSLAADVKESPFMGHLIKMTIQDQDQRDEIMGNLHMLTQVQDHMNQQGSKKIMNTFSHMHVLLHQQEAMERSKIISTLNFMTAKEHEEKETLEFYQSMGSSMGIFWSRMICRWNYSVK